MSGFTRFKIFSLCTGSLRIKSKLDNTEEAVIVFTPTEDGVVDNLNWFSLFELQI